MDKRLLGLVAFALVVAAGASYLLYQLISVQLERISKPAETQIFVAARDLPLGTLIRDADIVSVDWSAPVPEGALLAQEEIVNRGVISSIYRGEPIRDNRLAPKGAGAGLAATIPVGMRAVAVRVNDVVGVAGFAVPGMRVDVLIMGNSPSAPRSIGTQSKTLLQNVEVLSAGQQIERDTEGKPVQVPVVNLLVSPEDAEKLSLASGSAQIQLVLRNPLDTDKAKTKGTALQRLFEGDEPPPKPAPRQRASRLALPTRTVGAPPPPPPPVTVVVITGTAKAESKFAPEEPSSLKED